MRQFFKLIPVCLLIAAINISCSQQGSKKTETITPSTDYVALGDSISLAAQQALMQQLMAALKSGGPEYAVTFCSERAQPITDSLSKKYDCQISRLALRNRNPHNALQPDDRIVYDEFDQAVAAGTSLQPRLTDHPEEILYYKPIMLGMATCLQCHGKSNELDPQALAAIRARYPQDRATGFEIGQLRGMWKITFEKVP